MLVYQSGASINESHLNRFFLYKMYNFADNLMKFLQNLDLYNALIVLQCQVSRYKTDGVRVIGRYYVIYIKSRYFLYKIYNFVDNLMKFLQNLDR